MHAPFTAYATWGEGIPFRHTLAACWFAIFVPQRPDAIAKLFCGIGCEQFQQPAHD